MKGSQQYNTPGLIMGVGPLYPLSLGQGRELFATGTQTGSSVEPSQANQSRDLQLRNSQPMKALQSGWEFGE